MSKAFVRESDDEPDPPVFSRREGGPAGAIHYLTQDGARRLREELDRLADVERPRLAERADDPEAKRELQGVNRRIRHLQQVLHTAEIVPPPADGEDRAAFGAIVTVRGPDGEESEYRLVGGEEADPDRGWLSWQSPLAKALLNARAGQRVEFAAPSGKITLEIVRVRYS